MPTKLKKQKAAPVKRKRDREASTRALLEAAVQVFSEQGYDAATTRAVAKRAGVSEALIQRYFEGKAGLLLAVMRSFSETGEDDVISTLPFKPTVREEVLQILSQNCHLHQEQSSFIRVAMSRAIVDPALGRQLGSHIHERRFPVLKTRLLHYQQKGLISPDADLNAAAYAISGLSFTLGFMAPEVFAFDREKLKQTSEQIADMLARGLAGK